MASGLDCSFSRVLLRVFLTPYGFGLYKMILVTMADQKAMSVVLEWRPVQLHPSFYDACLLTLTALFLIGLLRFRLQGRLGELIFLAVLTYQAIEHRRNLPLAVFASAILATPFIFPVIQQIRAFIGGRLEQRRLFGSGQLRPTWGTPAAVLCLVVTTTYAVNALSQYRTDGSRPLEDIARFTFGVDRFPSEACSFMQYEQFPTTLKIYNDFNIGGFLILNCPQQPVFADGRIDLYAGPLLDGVMSIDDPGSAQTDLKERDKNFLRTYPFDCVVTANALAAKFFAQQPEWSLVYIHHPAPILDRSHLNAWIFLKHRPDLEGLITRSRSDWAAHNHGMMPNPGL